MLDCVAIAQASCDRIMPKDRRASVLATGGDDRTPQLTRVSVGTAVQRICVTINSALMPQQYLHDLPFRSLC
ncbi:hypothetical protein ACFRDV_26710 [Streptomyces fagopyri]|uniref:hypothetical protein n=1 Tax=Streptomyces fagopyri TaxID=2662397 RepID=UPI00368A173F